MRITERLKRPFAEASVSSSGDMAENVAVLSLESDNRTNGKPRRYEEEGIVAAVKGGLYEGVQVYGDHVEEGREDEPRPLRHLIGKLIKSRWVPEEKKVRGNLLLFSSDPVAQKVLEAAARPELSDTMGMSHDADGTAVETEQEEIVSEILRVYSVDVVTRPATTRGLKESARRRHTEAGDTMPRCTIKGADGDQAGVVVRGPVLEVQIEGEDFSRMIPADQVTMEADEEEPKPPEEEETTEADDAPPEDEKDKPMEEKKTESRAVRDPEKEALRKRVALLETRDHVRESSRDLPLDLQTKVRDRFAKNGGSLEEVQQYVGDLKEAMEAGGRPEAIEADDYHVDFERRGTDGADEIDNSELIESIEAGFGNMGFTKNGGSD